MDFFAFDNKYMTKLVEGDPTATEHFVAYFSELIRLKLRSRLQSREAIEDVRQETFLRVLTLLKKRDMIRSPDRLAPFVNAICNHVLMEHYRASKKNELILDNQMFEAQTDLSDRNIILHILEGFPEVDKKLLRAVVLEGKDRAETCREFQVDESHLTSLLQQVKERFQNPMPASEPSALSLLEAKDTERVLRKILTELNDRDRRLVQAVLLDERDRDDVCAEFAVSREYLRVLLHRVKHSFKSFYIDSFVDRKL